MFTLFCRWSDAAFVCTTTGNKLLVYLAWRRRPPEDQVFSRSVVAGSKSMRATWKASLAQIFRLSLSCFRPHTENTWSSLERSPNCNLTKIQHIFHSFRFAITENIYSRDFSLFACGAPLFNLRYLDLRFAVEMSWKIHPLVVTRRFFPCFACECAVVPIYAWLRSDALCYFAWFYIFFCSHQYTDIHTYKHWVEFNVLLTLGKSHSHETHFERTLHLRSAFSHYLHCHSAVMRFRAWKSAARRFVISFSSKQLLVTGPNEYYFPLHRINFCVFHSHFVLWASKQSGELICMKIKLSLYR